MYNAMEMPSSAIGMALSSPGLCSPGLYGDQGWSPCSSQYSDMGDDLEQDYFRSHLDEKKRQKRHTMMVWPMPPARIAPTRPLSFNKHVLRSPAESLSSGSASSSDESSAVTLADAPGFSVRHSPRKAMNKRFFSAPLPNLTATKDSAVEIDAVHIVSPNVFDESLPLMPTELLFEDGEVDEEYVKMARLEASMSLLGVQSGPRVGHYQVSSPTRSTPTSERMEQIDNDQGPGSVLSTESQSPTAGLCLLRMAFSPEHKAPTLQEQMAFASGLGNMCAWASPMKLTYASADDYLTPQHLGVTDEADEIEFDMLTTGQSERRHASRHIRQGVAASSAAGFVDKLHALSPISRLAYGSMDYDDNYNNVQRPISQFSNATSNAVSEVGSPILHGILSATSFASSNEDESVNGQVHDSPALAHEEYSYLAENDAFLATLQGSPQLVHSTSKSQSTHWPDAHGFNGNTLSPSLATPDLNMIGTPVSMNMIPSPCFEQDSVCPADNIEEPSVDMLPRSQSSASVLQRPRPISASRSVSFFTHNDVEADHHHLLTRKRVQKQVTLEEQSKDEKRVDASSLCAIPPRKASLAEKEGNLIQVTPSMPKSQSTTSIVFRDEPHPRHLLRVVSPESEARMAKSSSVGYLGPKAISQVREACRAKTVQLVGGDALAEQIGGNDQVVVPALPSMTSLENNGKPRSILKRVKRGEASSNEASFVQGEGGTSKHMPVLFVARTPSQRKRGTTGVAETEPENLAKAKLGLRTDMATRSSTVHALSKVPSKTSSSSRLQLVHDHGCPHQTQDDGNDDASLSTEDPSLVIAAELQQGISGMPNGFVLVVEETQTVVTSVLPTPKLVRM
jgi:hypothetical protein